MRILAGLFLTIGSVCALAQNAPAHREPLRNAQFKTLRGMAVENHDGEKLGTLKDFVLDAQSGRVKFAIIKSGGVGPLAKQKIVPGIGLSLESVKLRTLSMDVSAKRWTKAPVFERKRLQELSDPEKQREILAFLHFSDAGAEKDSSLLPTGRKGPDAKQQNRKLVLASEFVVKEILDETHPRLGKSYDLLVDTTSTRESFILFSSGKSAGSGDTFAVPLTSVLEIGKDGITVRAKQNDLPAAPPFRWETGSSVTVFRYVP